MSFNPDPSKQAQELIFSEKKMKSSYPSVYLNNIPIRSTSVHIDEVTNIISNLH